MASLNKRDNGKWEVRYLDPVTGKHPSKSFVAKKSAEKFKREIEIELESGSKQVDHVGMTVKMLCDLYLKYQEERRRDGRIGQGHYIQTKCHIDVSIIPNIGRLKLTDVSMLTVSDLYSTICTEGGLSGPSAKGRIARLVGIFIFAVKRGYMKDNPAQKAMEELRGVKASPVRSFDEEQARKVIETANTKRYRGKDRTTELLRCMVNLAAFCGMRKGEIYALQLQSIDYHRKLIKVRHNLTRWDELKGPKTKAGNRDIPLPTHIAAMLCDWTDTHYLENDRQLLFRNSKGEIINSGSFSVSYWQPLVERAGLKDGGRNFHFHALRHFAASWMIANQMPLTEVAKLLGHEHFDTTLQVYAHPIMDEHHRHAAFNAMATKMISKPVAPELRNDA